MRFLAELTQLVHRCFTTTLFFWIVWFGLPAQACQIQEPVSPSEHIFSRHLVGGCSSEEQHARAIRADALLEAIQGGKSLDLAGMIITGGLTLDRLPLEPIGRYAESDPEIHRFLTDNAIQKVRVIQGGLSIRDSLFQGVLATNLKGGALLIFGDVTMTGTTFQKSVDFSQAVFLGQVDFSEAVILHEGFFISAQFQKDTKFEKTNFGTHSRFHKANFLGNTSFSQSGFNGLAEFLEVNFAQKASFFKASFKMGTGFSGSHFKGPLDFSEALFEREAFFRFTVYEQEASFRGTTFRKVADFTNAAFAGNHDLTEASFKVRPDFSGSNIENFGTPSVPLQDPRFLVSLFVILVALTLIFMWNRKKRQNMYL